MTHDEFVRRELARISMSTSGNKETGNDSILGLLEDLKKQVSSIASKRQTEEDSDSDFDLPVKSHAELAELNNTLEFSRKKKKKMVIILTS